MISPNTIELIVGIVIVLIGYCAAATLAGAFRAWMALIMGDDTAQEQGFLTLNPFMHIDLVGLIVLMWCGWGWGRHVPVDPFNITGSYRRLRVFLASYADVGAYIFNSIIALTLLLFFDKNIPLLPHATLFDTNNISLAIMTHRYPTTPSITIIGCLILMSFILLNIGMGAFSLTSNSIDMGLWLTTRQCRQSFLQFNADNPFKFLITFIIFVVVFSFLFKFLSGLLFTIIFYSSVTLAHLLSIL